MRRFTYIIGSMDDFESYDALEAAYRNGTIGDYNASVFTFDVPDVGTDSLTVRDIATYIGRGLAFSSDWCMDGTFGDLLES